MHAGGQGRKDFDPAPAKCRMSAKVWAWLVEGVIVVIVVIAAYELEEVIWDMAR